MGDLRHDSATPALQGHLHPPTHRQWSLTWVGLSLLVRLLAWWPVVQTGVAPLYDECTYLSRAVAYGNVLRAWLHGRPSEPADWDRAYHNGGWPPLHPLLIGIFFAPAGPNLALARFVVLLQSAATTGVVFALTRRLCGRRAAACAAGLHALHPSFVAYSHLLWSETTYILVLTISLYFALLTVETARSGSRILAAAACGACLGLAGLTRAAALPLIAAIPLWIAWRANSRPRRLAKTIACSTVCLLCLAPWLLCLYQREGRLLPLSTAAGYNLYLGNNPWSLEVQARGQARAALQEYMNAHDVDRDQAARALALRHIRDDFAAFLYRCWSHARALFVPDWYVLRHLLYASYPPMPNGVAMGVIVVFSLAFAAFVTVALLGLYRGESAPNLRGLTLICLCAGILPHVLTIANSRMTLPLLALSLPAAGAGLSLLHERHMRRAAIILAPALLACIRLLNPALPEGALGSRSQISAHYAPVVRGMEFLFGAEQISCKDRVLLRYHGPPAAGHFKLGLPADAYFLNFSRQREIYWTPVASGEILSLEITSTHAAPMPRALSLLNVQTRREVTFQHILTAAWRRWLPTGFDGVEYIWLGAAGFTDDQISELLRMTVETPAQTPREWTE